MNAIQLNDTMLPERGTKVWVHSPKTTGRYIGTSEMGVVWIDWSHKPGVFERMVERFNNLNLRVQLSPRQAEIVGEALALLDESEPGFAEGIELRSTFIRGTRGKLAELASRIEVEGEYHSAQDAALTVWDSLGAQANEAHETFAVRQHMISRKILAAKLEGKRPNRRLITSQVNAEIRKEQKR